MVATHRDQRKDLDLSPQDQQPPEPAVWPKVFERLAWADGVVKARLYRGATAAVFHRITTRSGTPEGCTESLGKMAEGLGITRKTVRDAVKTIRADGYILVEGHLRSNYVCVPDFDKGVGYSLPQGRVLTTPGGRVVTTPKRTSSSKEKLKKRNPGVVDAKRVDDPVPETGVTTGSFFVLEEEGATEPEPELQPLDKVNHGERETNGFTVLEEEETGATTGAKRVERPIAQEWVDLNLPEFLMDSQCEWMLNHTWEVWKFHEVTQPYGWKFGKAAALKTVTKDMAARKKFRVDLVQHLMKAGLPSTATPSTWCLGCSKDTTTGHGNAFLQGGRRTVDTCEDCAQAPVPIVEIVRTGHRGLIACEGCGKKIKREPDKRFCYPCSKKLVDGPALARTL